MWTNDRRIIVENAFKVIETSYYNVLIGENYDAWELRNLIKSLNVLLEEAERL